MALCPRTRPAVGLAVALIAMPLSGCYHHVVREEGIASPNYDVYEPNRKEDLLDKADKAVWDAYDGERD